MKQMLAVPGGHMRLFLAVTLTTVITTSGPLHGHASGGGSGSSRVTSPTVVARRPTSFRVALAMFFVVTATDFAQQDTDFTLARGRVGPLTIGMTADEMVALFGQRRVKHVDLQLEGMRSPVLEIRLGNPSARRASLTAELFLPTENRIWRVQVFDRRFRTTGGLGVGSTLGQVRAHQHVQLLIGEGNVVAHVQELQMSFDFGSRWYPSVHLPASARVQSVSVLLPPGELRK